MKFTAAALLVATVAAADPTGCKPGLKLEVFSDDDCKKKVEEKDIDPQVKKALEPSAKELEDMTGKCAKTGTGTSQYVTCDMKDGISWKQYANEDCTGEAAVADSFGWGKCKGLHGHYVTFKGAMALQAAAVALAAAVGTQF